MKILMVNKFLYPRGGAETYMLKIGEYLMSQGHEVQYFGMYDDNNTVGNRLGLYTGNMDFHTNGLSRFLYPVRIIYSGEAYKKISRVIDDFKPDIVHMNNVNYQLSPSVIDAVYKKGVPMVMTVHDYQMICPNHMLYNVRERKICEKCVRGSTIHCIKGKCIHLSRVKSILGAMEGTVYRIRKNYSKVDLYICPSKFLEKKLLLGNSKVFEGKTKVICNYAKIPELSELAPGGRTEKKPYVVYVGRLSEEKGVRLIARAAEILPDTKFVIAGTGPDKCVLENYKNIDLKGFVSGIDLYRLIAEAQILILPSICYENCPLSILEAQAVGTPVITASVGGMAELVEDGVTGKHVSPMNGEMLAETISEVLNNSEELKLMSDNSMKKRNEIITLETYCDMLISVYEEIINRKKDTV